MKTSKLLAKIGIEVEDYHPWFDFDYRETCANHFDTLEQEAAFLATLAHESMGFRRIEENLSYSAKRLRQIWPRFFRLQYRPEDYARKPEKLANLVYAGRLGNDPDPEKGDGWRYRGFGYIQLTGKYNHEQFTNGLYLLHDDENIGDNRRLALACSIDWWLRNGLNQLVDEQHGYNEVITRKVNGGLHGHSRRLKFYIDILKLLAA